MLPSSTNMSASSSRLVDILYEFPILLTLYPLVTLPIFQDRHSVDFQGLITPLVIFWVNYGWQRGRGSAVEVDGGMTVLRPEQCTNICYFWADTKEVPSSTIC
ncbi:hypothetical protein OROMI_006936 [Orobanche minor]